MKISMIGHASIFVETQDHKFLMDPVLWDPHQEGLFDVCPQREVLHDLIPEFDVLIISHKHLDHFDIRSLAYLPKDVEVIIPKDPLIERSLRKLGYSKIYPLGDFRELKIGNTKIMTTRSENRVPEFGIILADETGVFWNCVDTELIPPTIATVLEHYPKIDFLLATWQPMMESNFQSNESLEFPYHSYGQVLYNINLINPASVAPGANAFKYIDGGSWLNQIVFPVTREKFCEDVGKVCPSVENNVFPLEPSDTVEFNHNQFVYTPSGCEFVKKIKDDREELDFSPVNVGNSLVDDNLDNYDLLEMEEAIAHKIEIDLTKLIQEQQDKIFLEHKRWNVIYQLEVVFPNGVQKWYCDFSQKSLKMEKGRNPLANLLSYTTASGFYSLIQKIKGWDYMGLGGYHRGYNKIYQVMPLGLVLPHYIQFPDPFSILFSEEDLEIIMRDREIEQWKDCHPNYASNSQTKKVKLASVNSDLIFNASDWLKSSVH